ncbi:MAG: hypothetical protein HUJ60_02225, partial [Bacilli bacterium]|nr:hypothetical protein [Bacilli bacterium]
MAMIEGVFHDVSGKAVMVASSFEGFTYLYGASSGEVCAILKGNKPEGLAGTLEIEGVDCLSEAAPSLTLLPSDVESCLAEIETAFSSNPPFLFVDASELCRAAQWDLAARISESFPRRKILLYAPRIKPAIPGVYADRKKPRKPEGSQKEESRLDRAFIAFIDDLAGIEPPSAGCVIPAPSPIVIEEEPLPELPPEAAEASRVPSPR